MATRGQIFGRESPKLPRLHMNHEEKTIQERILLVNRDVNFLIVVTYVHLINYNSTSVKRLRLM